MFNTSAVDTTSAAAGSQAGASQAKLEDDLNKFLNLLVTQLKNQDPLEPMDATEFTNQLVQFASVEQQIYQNSNLEKLLLATHTNQVSNLAGYLGTTVEGQADSFMLENSQAQFSYSLMDDAANNTVIITDDTGTTVHSFTGELTQGRHDFTWDGKDAQGNLLPDGHYNFQIAATDDAGLPIDYSRTSTGRVTAAGADGGEVTLYMGDVPLTLDQIISVRETPTVTATTTVP